MKKYEIPDMEVITFLKQDVIRTSDTDLNGYDNGDNGETSLDDIFGDMW